MRGRMAAGGGGGVAGGEGEVAKQLAAVRELAKAKLARRAGKDPIAAQVRAAFLALPSASYLLLSSLELSDAKSLSLEYEPSLEPPTSG